MSKGLALKRSEKNPDLHFFVEDSNGEVIEIRQTMEVVGNQVKVVISAPNNVIISRGEQLKK